jgi:hypothetical protein
MNFNNILLITDADGTLLNNDREIIEKDKTAIREFTDNGGLFTIATGRGVSLARVITDELKLKIPAVIFNGAAVYDFNKDVFLWKKLLPDDAYDYMKLLMEKFPTLGIEILRDDEVNVVRTNETEEWHIAMGCKNPLRRSFDDVPRDGWIKTLLVGEPDEIDTAIEFANKQGFKNIHMVRSAPIFYEILPDNVNKGTGFKKLLELMGLNDKYIVAAGDFMNDIEMIEMADLGVAVMNAEDCVKKAADLVVCDNNSGAVWEIVEYLKQQKYDYI